MALHLAKLALLTGTCPLDNIFVDAGPHIPSSEETPSCTDAWMGKGVQCHQTRYVGSQQG